MSESNPQSTATNGCYKKKTRGAVATVNGSVYQVELLMWFLQHFHDSGDKIFKISSECKEAEQVDDIVALYSKLENNMRTKKIAFMQLKYRKNKNPISEADLLDFDGYSKKKDDFVLCKYFKSFCKIAGNSIFKRRSVEYIAIVTNTDLKEDIKKHFEEDFAESIFMKRDIPNSVVYKLKIDSGDKQFLGKVTKNLMQSPASKTLANKMFERHELQTERKNALDFFSPELKSFKHFLSMHILEPHPNKKGYVKFRKSFIHNSYKDDEIDYSNVITDFKAFIEEKFKGNLEIFEFKVSRAFSKLIAKVIPALEPEQIPFEFELNDVEDFLKVLRIVKTPDEKEIELLIKKDLYPEEENGKDLVYSIFFKKMLDWYRNPSGEFLTLREAAKWFQDIKKSIAEFRLEVYFQSIVLCGRVAEL